MYVLCSVTSIPAILADVRVLNVPEEAALNATLLTSPARPGATAHVLFESPNYQTQYAGSLVNEL